VSREVGMFAERLLHDVGLHGVSFGAAQAHEWAWGVVVCVHRRLCALRGHDLILHFERRRLSLQCLDCGWASAGWMVDRPRFSYTPDRTVRRDVGAHVNRLERPPRLTGLTCRS